MKLEKFKKNNLRNKKILYSIVGVILLIGGFVLFQTFALFESKYEFNVIKGKVNEFNKSDIELSFTIDGVKGNTLPNKDSIYIAKSVTCANEVTAEWNNDLWGLFNINTNGKEKISCNIDFKKSLYKVIKIGDYVSYTPTNTSYTISSNLTGYSSDQTINPSELDLWRVIRKNADGTIEMISEYVSSTNINFYGKTGYANYVGALNTIAKQYETEGITSGSRYMGYDGQTEYITNISQLNNLNSTWGDNTNSTNSPRGSTREQLGGGDWLWVTDTDLVTKVIGNLKASRKGSSDGTAYYLSRRNYRYIYSGDIRVEIGVVNSEGNLGEWEDVYQYRTNTFVSYLSTRGVRPIIIINDKLFLNEDDGSSTSPYKIN